MDILAQKSLNVGITGNEVAAKCSLLLTWVLWDSPGGINMFNAVKSEQESSG